MKIPEMYEQKKPVFSMEIFPPKKKIDLESIYSIVEELEVCSPDFISVTYGAGGSIRDNGTCEIASSIKKRFGIETLAHLTCINSSREDVKEMLSRFRASGIKNVLTLRGDLVEGQEIKKDFHHANELAVEVQRQCNDDIEILGACYPEGHSESRCLEEDIQNLKYKIGAGARALITQLFFDNSRFYAFIGKARMMGINVPVSAGIMPIVKASQIERTVALSGAAMPDDFREMIERCADRPDKLFEEGIGYASEQIRDLIISGVDGIHLYIMNNPKVALRIYDNIKDLL